jgi:hypothetical protein
MSENETDRVRTPRWVKAFGIVALVLVALVVVMLVAGRGGHGPGRHAPGGNGIGEHSGPPRGVTHAQP